MNFDKVELMAAMSALVFVIGLLWRAKLNHDQANEERMDKYELGLERSRETILSLTRDYARIEGRMDGVESLSRRVLDEIRTLKKA